MISKKIAFVPGSFDPITIAHVDIVKRSLDLFDTIIIGIGINSSKPPYLTHDVREKMINAVFKTEPKIEVVAYKGLTIDFCKSIGAKHMIRGIRSVADFEYEKAIAQINGSLIPDIDTLFILSRPEYSSLSSSIVRDILVNGGNVDQFVPKESLPFLHSRR